VRVRSPRTAERPFSPVLWDQTPAAVQGYIRVLKTRLTELLARSTLSTARDGVSAGIPHAPSNFELDYSDMFKLMRQDKYWGVDSSNRRSELCK
jgi:hypothetical protein